MEQIFHILGLCGDNHINLLSIFVEGHNMYPIFNYIKTLFIKNGS